MTAPIKIVTIGGLASLLCLLSGCGEENNPAKDPVSNTFEMEVSGESWMPTRPSDEDECMQAFHAYLSRATTNTGQEIDFYTIEVFQDANRQTGFESENIFKLYIWDLKEPGLYTLDGNYENRLSSSVYFKRTMPDGEVKRYVNPTSSDNPFLLEVKSLIPVEGSSVYGLSGSFFGTLLNELDSNDVLEISSGEFYFEKVNHYNFDQCLP